MAYIPDNLRKTRIRDGISRAVCEIYEAFCEYADYETGFTFKSIEKIADECEIRHNSARVYLKELIEKGWIIPAIASDGTEGVIVKSEKTGWKSRSERSKPVDKKLVTPVEVDKKFVESDKKIVKVDKKFVTPNKEVLNQSFNQTFNQEENLSPAREPHKTKVNNSRYGIAVSEFDEGKQTFTDEIFDGLKTRLGTPAILPKEFEWIEAVNFAWLNKFPSTEFLKTYDLLERIRKLRRKEWRITAGMIESNIADTAKLELEIKNLEKSNEHSTKTNGSNGNFKRPAVSETTEDALRRIGALPTGYSTELSVVQ